MVKPAAEDVMDEMLHAAKEARDQLNQQTSPSCTKKAAEDKESLPSMLEEERSPLGDEDGTSGDGLCDMPENHGGAGGTRGNISKPILALAREP